MTYMSLKYRVQWPTFRWNSAEPPYTMTWPSTATAVCAPRPISLSPSTDTFCQTFDSVQNVAKENMDQQITNVSANATAELRNNKG